jgi:hypothetical protein
VPKFNKLLSRQYFTEFVFTWKEIRHVKSQTGMPNAITWKLSTDEEYSTKSAYRSISKSSHTDFSAIIWKIWARPKCKFFNWLAIQNIIWTSVRLAARGLASIGDCPPMPPPSIGITCLHLEHLQQ